MGHIGSNASGVIVEPYMITLNEQSDIFPTFQHGGIARKDAGENDFDAMWYQGHLRQWLQIGGYRIDGSQTPHPMERCA